MSIHVTIWEIQISLLPALSEISILQDWLFSVIVQVHSDTLIQAEVSVEFDSVTVTSPLVVSCVE